MIEKILAYILACCNNSEFEQTTVALISENLKISRSQVSVVLNKLVKENKLIRIESKPGSLTPLFTTELKHSA